MSPTLQVDSLLSEPPGKPKNTGAGSLSLLQGNFQFQESNSGLLHCKQILYQLSYQGSPLMIYNSIIFLFTNQDAMVLSNSYIIIIVKDIYQFSQSIAR